mmetsp:Transcript_6274/g.23607  ORF Transcript_6274/g.23607 Transcript_6274/m.23607 type:complete len:242 (-) Transcript_6274:524-1249(-)
MHSRMPLRFAWLRPMSQPTPPAQGAAVSCEAVLPMFCLVLILFKDFLLFLGRRLLFFFYKLSSLFLAFSFKNLLEGGKGTLPLNDGLPLLLEVLPHLFVSLLQVVVEGSPALTHRGNVTLQVWPVRVEADLCRSHADGQHSGTMRPQLLVILGVPRREAWIAILILVKTGPTVANQICSSSDTTGMPRRCQVLRSFDLLLLNVGGRRFRERGVDKSWRTNSTRCGRLRWLNWWQGGLVSRS